MFKKKGKTYAYILTTPQRYDVTINIKSLVFVANGLVDVTDNHLLFTITANDGVVDNAVTYTSYDLGNGYWFYYVEPDPITVSSIILNGNETRLVYFDVYDETISDLETLRIKVLSLVTSSFPKHFYYIPPHDLSRLKDDGLVLALNANSLVRDNLLNLSGGSISLSSVDRRVFRKLGNSVYINTPGSFNPAPFSSQINLGKVYTIAWKGQFKATNNFNYLFYNASPYNEYSLNIVATSITHRANDGVTSQNFNSVNTILHSYINKNIDIIVVRDNLNCKYYINGLLVDEITGTNNPDFLAEKMIQNGQISASNNLFVDDFRVFTRAFSIEEILDYHNSFARQVNYKEDFSDYPVGETRIKNNIPGTGSYEVQELDNTQSQLPVGKKVLKCLSDGTYVIPSNKAYGEWEFRGLTGDITNGILGTRLPFLYQGKSGNYPDFGYDIIFDNVQLSKIRFAFRKPGFTTIFNSEYIFFKDKSYDILIQRLSSKGKFPLIGDGIEYNVGTFAVFYRETTPYNSNPYQLVPVSSGSNPATDNTYTTSKYMVLDFDADDSISEIITREGVQQSVTLPATVFGPIEESDWNDVLVWDDAEVWID